MSQTIKEQLLKLFWGVCGKPVKPSGSRCDTREPPQSLKGCETREPSQSLKVDRAQKRFLEKKHWGRNEKPHNRPWVSPAKAPELSGQKALAKTKDILGPKDSIPSKPCITRISADARLHLSCERNFESYDLISDEMLGIESRFDDSATEIKIGLDFGTSTVKVVVKTDTDFIAVPFIQAEGISAYLLPTQLHQRKDGTFSLSSKDPVNRLDLKLQLLNNSQGREGQIYASIFLALVLRHVRGWLFSTYSKYDDETISWECSIGYPSTENDSQAASIWRELIYRSWILSVQPGEISFSEAELLWKCALEDFEDQISFDYFNCMPEVVAAVAGFLRNQPIYDDFKGNYTLIDIGSGTVDISAFSFQTIPNQHCYARTLFSNQVEHLGTSNCHHSRLTWLKNLMLKAKESTEFTDREKSQLSRFIQEIEGEAHRVLLAPIKNSICEYFSGIQGVFDFHSPDTEFARALTNLLAKVRFVCDRKRVLSRDDISRMPVFFCGGGARSLFYRGAFLRQHPNISWLNIKKVLENGVIKELANSMVIPIDINDYDRLLVAYGLSAIDPPKSFIAEERAEQPVRGVRQFVSKEML